MGLENRLGLENIHAFSDVWAVNRKHFLPVFLYYFVKCPSELLALNDERFCESIRMEHGIKAI